MSNYHLLQKRPWSKPALATLFTVAVTMSGVAFARDNQDFSEKARKRLPYSFAVGLYIPTVGGGASASVGSDSWVTIRYPVGQFDFRINSHTQTFNLAEPGSSNSIATVETSGFDALYRFNAFYVGPGVAFATQTANTTFFPFSRPWETVYTLTAGYDFTTRIFVEAIWQSLAEDPYRAVTVGLGYRF